MENTYNDLSDTRPNYGLLPLEIINKIYSYLHPQDRLSGSLTCKNWMEATELSEFRNDFTIHFSKITFGDNFYPARAFLESFRSFSSITFTDVEISDCQRFFERHGSEIINLSFTSCEITERKLTNIIKCCPNIEFLKVENCKDLFMSGRLFDELLKNGLQMNHLSKLSLANNRYLSDAIFNRIMNLTTLNLKALDLSGCHISFHKGLYRKFYPASQNEPSESVLTFHFINKVIEQHAEKLTELNFNNTLIDGNTLTMLSEVEGLSLNKLQLKACEQLTNDGLVSLLRIQKNLQHLDLTQSVRLTDVSLYEICENLKELKTLKLRRCRALTDMGVKSIVELQKLEVLDISECESLTSAAIVGGIAKDRNETLKELYCSALNICEKAILQITENLPFLRVLDLSYNFNYLNDLCVQMIFKNLIWLRVLNLDCCDKISDAGMTGIKMRDKVSVYEKSKAEPKDEISSKKNNIIQNNNEIVIINQPRSVNNFQDDFNFKISLRTKAEEEIINDARRKKAIMELCELNKENDNECSSYSIARLRGLRVLRLGACNKISDVSLKYNFILPELKEINLSKCSQITLIGIQNLVQNCPALEVVDLSECYGINDKCIELLAEKLNRLSFLSIQRCSQLTDFTLDYIAAYCKKLKILNMNGCRSISGDPHLRLSNLKFLNDISCARAGDMPSAIKPLPPPFPMRIL